MVEYSLGSGIQEGPGKSERGLPTLRREEFEPRPGAPKLGNRWGRGFETENLACPGQGGLGSDP